MVSVLESAPSDEPERPPETHDRRPTTVVGVAALSLALALGIAGDGLLRATPWGVNLALWVAGLIGAVVALGRHQRSRNEEYRRWALVPALLFAACLAWRDSLILNLANIMAVLIALALAALRTHQGRLHRAGVSDYGLGLIDAGVHAMIAPFLLVFQDVRWQDIPRDGWTRHAVAIVRGLAVGIPLVFVFGLLFVAADAAFEGIVRSVLTFSLSEVVGHLLLALALAWLIAGFLRQAFISRQWESPLPSRATALRFGMVETTVALGLLNGLFLLFVVVQFRYFFGGASLVEASSTLTYSEYARRGFFELVTVAALLLPILLVADWAAHRDNVRQERLFRLLAAALVMLLFVIMVSAVQRMRLYVDEYGLTELRLYPTAFMAWLTIVFVWFLGTVLRGRRERFAVGGLIAGFVVLLAVNALNPDGLIARVNAARDLSPRPFDAEYAGSLSADAVPALIDALPSLSAESRQRAARRLLARWSTPEQTDWRTWNWGRSEARRLVEANRPMLAQAAEAVP